MTSTSSAVTGSAACTPQERVTRSLLAWGVVAGPFYVLATVVEGLLRPGFDFTRHDWSLLANGPAGWVHVLVLVLAGLMTIAAAAGLRRHLAAAGGTGRRAAPILIGVYGAGLVGGGVFSADPAYGFPPGTPDGPGAVSWHGLLHLVCGGLGFLALIAGCVVLAVRFGRAEQRVWSVATAVVGAFFLAAFAGIATGSPAFVLVFTAAVVAVWTWFALLCRRYYAEIGR